MPEPENQSLSMIEQLVGFDTTSHKSNLQLVEFVRDTLSELGVKSVLVADETVARAADSALAPQTLPAPLPGGVEVQILERRSSWLRIRLASGRDAWIPESAAAEISDSGRKAGL